MSRILTILLLIVANNALARQQPVVPDTSFTTYGAYKAALKKYPFVTIANPPVPASIGSKTNLVYWTFKNGRELKLDVFYPSAKSKKSYPAVLFVYGGGWKSGSRVQHVPMAQQLAAKGYVTITADYRLSGEAIYPAAVNDLKTAIRWLRIHAKIYNADSNKIAVWGFSAGGQLAALIGTTGNSDLFPGNGYQGHSDAVQAIVDVDGTLAFIHPESGEGDDSKGKSAATLWFGHTKTERPDLWNQAAALNHTDNKTPQIAFINSSVNRMHAGREDMIRKLDSLHIYSEVHAMGDTPHPFCLLNPWFEPTLNYTAAFLDKVFK